MLRRVPVAVGAIGVHGRQLGAKMQNEGWTSAESLGERQAGETENNMRWFSPGTQLSICGLMAKPMPTPKKEPMPEICYELQWQVRSIF